MPIQSLAALAPAPLPTFLPHLEVKDKNQFCSDTLMISNYLTYSCLFVLADDVLKGRDIVFDLKISDLITSINTQQFS